MRQIHADGCYMCGGSGEVQVTTWTTAGCPFCIQTERDTKITTPKQRITELESLAQAEPVAYLVSVKGEPELGSLFAEEATNLEGQECRPLYTAPQHSSPPGWKLVPVEPTMEMLNAGVDSGGIGLDYHEAIGRFIVAYSAMLAAAPEKEGGAA